MGKKKKNKQPKAAERVGVGDGESVPLDQSQNQDGTGQVDRTFVSEAVDVRFYAQNADLDLSGDRPDGSQRVSILFLGVYMSICEKHWLAWRNSIRCFITTCWSGCF